MYNRFIEPDVHWTIKQSHEEEVMALLKDEGCIGRPCGPSGIIRRWKKDTWKKLNAIGHTSLNVNKCACRNNQPKGTDNAT